METILTSVAIYVVIGVLGALVGFGVSEALRRTLLASRQRQVDADLQRAWDRDPIVLLETKGTPQVHGKAEAIN